jgi:hypothetical protein
MPIQEDARDRLTALYKDAIRNDSAKQSSSPADNKFNINTLVYPSDLGGSDLKHYVEFQINVRGKSEFNKDARLFEVKRQSDASLTEKELQTAVTTGAGLAGAAIGYGITKKIQGLFGRTGGAPTSTGNRQQSTTVNVIGAAAGAAAAATVVNASTLLKPDTLFRISDVIALYMDGPPTVKYGMNYANKELGTFAGILANAAGIVTGKTTGEAATATGLALAKIPSAFGSVDAAALVGASAKVALNPFKEVLFESVDFRAFAFKYKFLPKSPEEVRQVKSIIELFKFHMHPEISEGKLFFIYPSEFQITYYYGTEKNTYFHKMASCVLESMDVSYGGEQFSSFRGGEPTEINLSLTFRETEILTKKMIKEGY